MAQSTDVILPKGVDPRFPDKCITCHGKPNGTVRVAENTSNMLLVFFVPIFWLFGWNKQAVPICSSCKPKFRMQRWGREIVCWVIVIVGVWLIYPYVNDLSSWKGKLVILAGVIVIMIPYLIFEFLVARVFDMMNSGSNITYEFESEDYAMEFNDLNIDNVVGGDFYYEFKEPIDVKVNSSEND